MILLLALLASAPDEVVARANRNAITAGQLAARMTQAKAAGGAAKPELLVEDLINEALIADEGYLQGLQKDPEVVAAVDAERRRLAAERLVETEVASMQVPDSVLQQMYHGSADQVRLEVVILSTEAEAKAALERLRKGAALAEEAKHSIDPNLASQGGQLGVRSRGQLDPALATAAFAAPLKTWSGPVKLELGVAVFRVLDRQIGDELGYAAKKADLRRFAEKQMRGQARVHYLAQLRKQANAKIDEAFLKSTGTRLDGRDADHVVATVYGKPIKYGAVVAEVKRLFGGVQGGHASGFAVKAEYSWDLVDRALLERAAMQRGLGDDPAVKARLVPLERDAMVRTISARLRNAAGKPSETEIEAYYRAHQADFKRPARRRCAHIVVNDKAQAEQIRGQAQRGEPFEELARKHSLDRQSAAQGGVIGDIGDEQLTKMTHAGEPGLAQALRAVKPGEVSPPVRSQMGWHLVRCSPQMGADVASLAEMRGAIAERMTAERQAKAVVQHIGELRQAAHIQVERAALAKVRAQ